MKTFLYSIPNKIQSFSKKLDVKAALCGKSWEVFNDEGVKQLFIFNEDGSFLITYNGKVFNASWKFIPQNSSILITTGEETIMFRPAFFNKDVFALQQDGVERYLFMIDEKKKPLFQTLNTLTAYIDKETAAISNEKIETISQRPIGQQRENAVVKYPKKAKEREREEIKRWFIENKELVEKRMEDKQTKAKVGMFIFAAVSFIFLLFCGIALACGESGGVFLIIAILAVIPFMCFLANSTKYPAEHLRKLCHKEFSYHTSDEINKIYEEL